MEAILVRNKDGICRNVTTTALGPERYKRNTDIYKSICHFEAHNGKTLHCCENENKSTELFTRILPSPFKNMLLFGDVLFVLEDNKEMINFGLNEFRLFMENQHPELSPGHVIRPNLRKKVPTMSIDDTEDEEVTTQEVCTMGTLVTQETSDEEEEDEEEEIGSDDNLDD